MTAQHGSRKRAVAGAIGNETAALIWRKNGREFIRVSVDFYKGRQVIDIRVYYRDAKGELQPTRKGVTLDSRHGRKLRKAVKEVTLAAERQR